MAVVTDWVVRCETHLASSTILATRLCEMAQTMQDQLQQFVALQALGRTAKDESMHIVAQVLVNLQVGPPAKLCWTFPIARPTRR